MAAIERFRSAALITAPKSAFLVAALSLASACSAEHTAGSPVASPARADAPHARGDAAAEGSSDERIRAAVDRRLATVAGLSTESRRVNVENGIVTLLGQVERSDQRAHAAELAVRTPGVRAVVNRLMVGGATEPAIPLRVGSGIARTDQEIAEAVARSLHADEYLRGRPLKFLVQQGRVHLSGQVQTVFEKHWARNRARVPGVVAVEDADVRVLSNPEPPPPVYSATSPSDLETASAIRDAFRADPRVPGATVGLDVEYGVVTLTGAVSTLEQKLAAGEDAQNAPGASAVVNRLEVRAGAAATAEDLEAQVLARLRAHPSVSADSIRVTTHGQAVRLEGEVGSPFERTVAERAVASVPGVLLVDNQLAIGATPKNFRDDEQIEAEVERELALDPLVEGAHLRVSVEHGIVTIRGKVANAQVYDAVLTKAFEASPRGVVNELWRAEPEHFVYSE